MTVRIDLQPLMANRPATEMLLLARGQLNCAFRQSGYDPPDPLPPGPAAQAAVDDPLEHGMQQARARFGTAFDAWAAAMPDALAAPVLEILRRTHDVLVSQPSHAAAVADALCAACAYLEQAR